MYWKDALNKKIINEQVFFNNEQVSWQQAITLGQKGVDVPEKLITYPNDNEIDFSDIPEITDNL